MPSGSRHCPSIGIAPVRDRDVIQTYTTGEGDTGVVKSPSDVLNMK